MKAIFATKRAAAAAALATLSLLGVAIVSLGNSRHHGGRRLYESDDDDNCLADEGCRFMLGISCLLLVPFLILWNELRFVRLETLYGAAQRFIRELDVDVESHTGDHIDGKFVCFSGRLRGETTLTDELVPDVVVHDAILLQREIEILQCYEVEKNKKHILKKKWYKLPQPDVKRFPEEGKNPIGNWEILADGNRLVSTGHKKNGDPIRFGDNCVVARASNPTLGSFAVPMALMNEMFLGSRYVHRLGEFELIKSSQGVWQLVSLVATPEEGFVHVEGLPSNSCYKRGGYVYDGQDDAVGTIRMSWKYASPQDFTVAAEAVAPGRPCELGYGLTAVSNTHEPGAMMRMVKDDLKQDLCGRCCMDSTRDEGGYEPLAAASSYGGGLGAAEVSSKQWTVAPFTVTTNLPPFGQKMLGKLWMYAPGLLDSRELFLRANRYNARCLWKVRGLAYILLLVGWLLAFEPIVNMVRYIPILRGLVSLTFALGAFVLATACCTTCTLISRITARPIQSIMVISGLWASILLVLQWLEVNDDTNN